MKHIIMFILIILLFGLIGLYIRTTAVDSVENFALDIPPHDMPSIINPANCDKISLEPTQDEVISDSEDARINLYKITRNNTNYKFIIQKDFKQTKIPIVQTYLESPLYKSSNQNDMASYGLVRSDPNILPLTLALKQTKTNVPVNNFYGYNYSFTN